MGEGVTGRIWARGEPDWIDDLGALDDLTEGEGELRTTIAPHQRTMVVVPVRGSAAAEPLGVLQLVGRSRPRDTDLMEVLSTIANTIGRYVERERADHALRSARDAAQLADRAKSVFVSRISHELRTPLNAILGFAQLLERDVHDPLQRERIAQILAGGRHLTDMIDDLLDVAAVERGEMGVSLEAVAATDVLREVLDLTRPLIHERHLQLDVDAHEGLYRYVWADYQRLRQVLLNLISNAVKYNRPGGGIRLSFDDAEGERLRFLVRDTGPGIEAERLPLMFHPFERLGAEDGTEQGTGLGLFVSKGLVEAMGGELTVRTAPGEGSTFVVDLAQAAAPEAAAPAVLHERAPLSRTLSGVPVTVLYIEDNAANIRLVRDILSAEPQVELLVATDGRTGLALAREREPDLILLDVHLPDLQGDEILEGLRAVEPTRTTPVIVISADASAGQERRFLVAGADAYLTKPLDVDAFIGAVNQTLRPARTPEPVAPREDPDDV
jgi:signal transduction histidine kinase/ActR/RegA family two-component response regulator